MAHRSSSDFKQSDPIVFLVQQLSYGFKQGQ